VLAAPAEAEKPNMNQALYTQFSAAIVSLLSDDMPSALERTESVDNQAVREHGMCAGFTTPVERGRPVDRLLDVFDGHMVGDAVAVITQLREELADELTRRGAEADVVRELREGGPRHGPKVVLHERQQK
jgi:hypothetical protein